MLIIAATCYRRDTGNTTFPPLLFVMTAIQDALDLLRSCTRSVHRELDKQLKSLWLYMAVHDNGHRLKSDGRFQVFVFHLGNLVAGEGLEPPTRGL